MGFRRIPSFRPLEQRQREDKARREQADAEQQAGQEQTERVHGERIPGLELNEHQRWVRTGFRRSPLRGDRALGSDHATKANVVSRRLSGLRQPLAAAVATKAQSPSADPGRAQQTARCDRNEPAMSVKRGAGGSAAIRDVEPCLAQALRCEKVPPPRAWRAPSRCVLANLRLESTDATRKRRIAREQSRRNGEISPEPGNAELAPLGHLAPIARGTRSQWSGRPASVRGIGACRAGRFKTGPVRVFA